MGVKGLTGYTRDRKAALVTKYINIKDEPHHPRLLFDGNALLWALMKNAPCRQFAGDYDTLYCHFQNSFRNLKKLGVIVYVVMDGGCNIPMKTDTICRRHKNKIKDVAKMNDDSSRFRHYGDLPLPILSKMLFKQVMRDEGVNFVVAEEEADLLVASLANQLECYAVTNDSDFCLLDIKHGVILMSLFFECIENVSYECPVNHIDDLARYLEIEKCLLPFIALVLGNDYSVDGYLAKAQDKCGFFNKKTTSSKVAATVRFLKQYRTCEEILESLCEGDQGMDIQLRKELEEYDLHPWVEWSRVFRSILEGAEPCSDDNTCQGSIKKYLMELVFRGEIETYVLDIVKSHTHFVDIQSENTLRKASSIHSQVLRCRIYEMLVFGEGTTSPTDSVSEYVRRGKEYTRINVAVKRSRQTLENLLRLPIADRQDFIFDLLEISSQKKACTPISEASLLLLSLHHIIRQSERIQADQIQALLITFLVCRRNDSPPPAKLRVASELRLDASHLYCTLQSILFYLLVINTLLGNPFPSPQIRHLLSGSRFHNILDQLEKGIKCPEDYLTDDTERKDFETFSKLLHEDDSYEPRHLKPTHPYPAANSSKKQQQVVCQSSVNNRFHSLSLLNGDEE